MATVIQIKRSSGTSAPATLKLGELAYTHGTGTQGNLGDRLFIGEGGVDGNGDANNITVIGGQYFSDLLDHVPGVATANSALLLDSNKAVDEIIVGTDASAGGQIKLQEGTNNGTNLVGLKAPNSLEIFPPAAPPIPVLDNTESARYPPNPPCAADANAAAPLPKIGTEASAPNAA